MGRIYCATCQVAIGAGCRFTKFTTADVEEMEARYNRLVDSLHAQVQSQHQQLAQQQQQQQQYLSLQAFLISEVQKLQAEVRLLKENQSRSPGA